MELLCPPSCIPVPKIEDDCYDWWERHEHKLRQVRENKYKIVFFGDSITHFWTQESAPRHGGDLWDKLYGSLPVLNLGYGFDRTQNVLWRMDHGELEGQNPALFVVNIGTNQFSITPGYPGDTPENAAAGILKVLETLRSRFPEAFIVDMALFPRGGKFKEISGTNAILREKVPCIADTALVDLTFQLGFPDSGEPDPRNYQQDLCHLNPNGYRIWAKAVAPYIEKYAK